MNYATEIETIIGKLALISDDEALIKISFGGLELMNEKLSNEKNAILTQAETELQQYFSKRRKKFTVPIKITGSAFQKSCYNALLEIPYGEVRSYRDIAEHIGNIKACRAVGMANNKNPLPIIIPCHRVIGINGSMTGYAGGIDAKKTLLILEKE